MMANPTFKMLLLLLAGLTVLVSGNEIKNETTSTVSPKVEKVEKMSPMTTMTKVNITTLEPTPPLAAVMDLFQAPLAAFKPKMAPKHPDEKTYNLPIGRAEGTTAAPSNIFFRAGSNLGSAAQSLTGWFNNRMIPQALRPASSTTPQPKPQVIHIISNPQIKRKEMAPQQTLKKPKTNRKKPVKDQSQDFEDIEESVNDENDDDIDEDEENFNLNQDLIDNVEEDDEDYDQVRNRKGSRQTKRRPNQQFFYIEEEIDGDDDFDYEVQMPARKPQRKQQQQQQNFPNRRRKNSKKQQMKKKPMKQGQRPQRVQIVNRPGAVQNQVKRKRRPAASFELVPISQNQAINLVSTKKKPNAPAQNNNRPLTQFFNIPWSRLGLAGPPKEPSSNNEKEPKPIIVRIPSQQNQIKRKRRPTKKPVNSMKKRKPAKGQFQDQAPVFSVLSEQQIRELFNQQQANQQQQPLKVTPQLANLPVTLNGKKKPVKNESEDMPSEESNNNENEDNNNESEVDEKPQAESEAENDKENNNSYIYVGPANDDKEIDLDLYRHYNSQGDLINGRSSSRHAWEEDEYDEDDYDEE